MPEQRRRSPKPSGGARSSPRRTPRSRGWKGSYEPPTKSSRRFAILAAIASRAGSRRRLTGCASGLESVAELTPLSGDGWRPKRLIGEFGALGGVVRAFKFPRRQDLSCTPRWPVAESAGVVDVPKAPLDVRDAVEDLEGATGPLDAGGEEIDPILGREPVAAVEALGGFSLKGAEA